MSINLGGTNYSAAELMAAIQQSDNDTVVASLEPKIDAITAALNELKIEVMQMRQSLPSSWKFEATPVTSNDY